MPQGDQRNADHPQPADLFCTVLAVAVLRIARDAQQAVPLPAADRIRGRIHGLGGGKYRHGGGPALGGLYAHPLIQIIGRSLPPGAFLLHQIDVFLRQPDRLLEIPPGGTSDQRKRGAADPASRPAPVHRQPCQTHLFQVVERIYAIPVGKAFYMRQESPLLVQTDRVRMHADRPGDFTCSVSGLLFTHVVNHSRKSKFTILQNIGNN